MIVIYFFTLKVYMWKQNTPLTIWCTFRLEFWRLPWMMMINDIIQHLDWCSVMSNMLRSFWIQGIGYLDYISIDEIVWWGINENLRTPSDTAYVVDETNCSLTISRLTGTKLSGSISADDKTNTFLQPNCLMHWGGIFGDLNWRNAFVSSGSYG